MILTRDIVPCAPFLYGLLNTLAIKGTGNNYFIKSILNILESLINSSNSDSFNEPDMQFIKSMLAEKKSLSENSVLTFFSNQNDENINKILLYSEPCKIKVRVQYLYEFSVKNFI